MSETLHLKSRICSKINQHSLNILGTNFLIEQFFENNIITYKIFGFGENIGNIVKQGNLIQIEIFNNKIFVGQIRNEIINFCLDKLEFNKTINSIEFINKQVANDVAGLFEETIVDGNCLRKINYIDFDGSNSVLFISNPEFIGSQSRFRVMVYDKDRKLSFILSKINNKWEINNLYCGDELSEFMQRIVLKTLNDNFPSLGGDGYTQFDCLIGVEGIPTIEYRKGEEIPFGEEKNIDLTDENRLYEDETILGNGGCSDVCEDDCPIGVEGIPTIEYRKGEEIPFGEDKKIDLTNENRLYENETILGNGGCSDVCEVDEYEIFDEETDLDQELGFNENRLNDYIEDFSINGPYLLGGTYFIDFFDQTGNMISKLCYSLQYGWIFTYQNCNDDTSDIIMNYISKYFKVSNDLGGLSLIKKFEGKKTFSTLFRKNTIADDGMNIERLLKSLKQDNLLFNLNDIPYTSVKTRNGTVQHIIGTYFESIIANILGGHKIDDDGSFPDIFSIINGRNYLFEVKSREEGYGFLVKLKQLEVFAKIEGIFYCFVSYEDLSRENDLFSKQDKKSKKNKSKSGILKEDDCSQEVNLPEEKLSKKREKVDVKKLKLKKISIIPAKLLLDYINEGHLKIRELTGQGIDAVSLSKKHLDIILNRLGGAENVGKVIYGGINLSGFAPRFETI